MRTLEGYIVRPNPIAQVESPLHFQDTKRKERQRAVIAATADAALDAEVRSEVAKEFTIKRRKIGDAGAVPFTAESKISLIFGFISSNPIVALLSTVKGSDVQQFLADVEQVLDGHGPINMTEADLHALLEEYRAAVEASTRQLRIYKSFRDSFLSVLEQIVAEIDDKDKKGSFRRPFCLIFT
jgi:hypothetical protein